MRCLYLLPIIVAVLYAGSEYFGPVAIALIPYVPVEYLHNGVAFSMKHMSVLNHKLEKSGFKTYPQCFMGQRDQRLLVLAAGSKGGSAFVVQLGMEIMTECGHSYGFGRKLLSAWPAAPEIPPFGYKSELYVAASNPYRWPEYAESINATTIKCIIMTRDPFSRFVSLYKYARDGGESGLKGHAKMLDQYKTHLDRLGYLWNYFGKATMLTSHNSIMASMNRPECAQIKFEDFMEGGASFEKGTRKLLRALDVRPEMEENLVARLKRLDISKVEHSHQSGRSLEPGEEVEIKTLIRKSEEIMALLSNQQQDLGYK